MCTACSADIVHLTGHLRCANPAEAEVLAVHLPAHIRLTREEPGCLSFAVTPTDDPLVWQVDERFAGPEAFEAHQARTHGSDWFHATKGIWRDYQITGWR